MAVRAGAVPGGTNETGFCAVWHEEPAIASTASTAIRIWSFATRIFFYEIRIAPWSLNSWILPKSYLVVCLGSTAKRTAAVTFGTGSDGYHAPNYQTAEAGKGLNTAGWSFARNSYRSFQTYSLRPASNPDARFGSAFLMSARESFSESARSASLGASASEAKRKAIS